MATHIDCLCFGIGVMDMTKVSPAQQLAMVAEIAGVRIQGVKFAWASVPCDTLLRLDPSNLRETHHREYCVQGRQCVSRASTPGREQL